MPQTGRTALFWLLLLLALALRLAALIPASLHHPDEILQYLEPAHRLVFGYGIETWEYRYHMRGWLLPLVLSWPMALGAALSPNSDLYLILPRILAVLVSLLIPLGAYMLGRTNSIRHGLIAMAVAATWAETVFFSSHILSEVASIAFFLPAAALVMGQGGSSRRSSLVLAGALLGLAVAMRFHYAPAIAVFLAIECGIAIRARWLPIAAGGVAGLALAGLGDMAVDRTPLLWIATNLYQNLANGRSADYGVEPPWRYVLLLGGYWLWATPVIGPCLVPVLRRYRALLAAAAVNFTLLSMIGHKEYRFMLLTSTICVVVAAIGSLDWLDRWRRAAQLGEGRRLALAIAGWALLSASIAAGPFMRGRWTDDGPGLLAARDAAALPGLCGLALHRLNPWQGGGYSYLHRRVPVYLTWWRDIDFLDARGVERTSAAWNAVIAPVHELGTLPGTYRRIACHGEGAERVCLLQRPGGCQASAASKWELQSIIRRHDN